MNKIFYKFSYLKKISSVLLFVVFLLGITPKKTLHTWFANRRRPVPSFLLLDQLSQAHFSPDSVPREDIPQERLDSDRKAVKGLFALIFDVVESLKGKFQVIITDHPDFTDDLRFQAALRERWRDGVKLVPEDWPTSEGAI